MIAIDSVNSVSGRFKPPAYGTRSWNDIYETFKN